VSIIWEKLIEFSETVQSSLNENSTLVPDEFDERFNNSSWINKVWKNNDFIRAHLDIVDARETKKLWMMHLCIFPQYHSNAPIFGFDVIAGKDKITGLFLDLSPTVITDSVLTEKFAVESNQLNYSKKRELPDWAKNIFSEYMVAAGNVNDINELNLLLKSANTIFNEYMLGLSKTNNTVSDISKVKHAFNYYAENQRKNPHTPKVMKSLGLNEDDVDIFCKDVLFPYFK